MLQASTRQASLSRHVQQASLRLKSVPPARVDRVSGSGMLAFLFEEHGLALFLEIRNVGFDERPG